MKTTNRNQEPVAALTVLPDDIRQWITPDQLAERVEALLQQLDWEEAEIQELLRTHPEFRAAVLLRVMLCALAIGHCETEHIRYDCKADPLFRRLCERQAPTVGELVLFRQKNRSLIEVLLGELLKQIVCAKLQRGLLPLAVKRYVADLARVRLDAAELADRCAWAA